MPILQTERLTLCHLTVNDAPFIFELLNDPDFLNFIGDRGIRTPNDAKNYIQTGPINSYEQHGFGLYLVRLKEGKTPTGLCGLLKRETLDDVDIGYAFLPEFRGKGYAFESAAAILKYGRTVLHLDRIVAITSPDNLASIKVLEKLGLQFEKNMDSTTSLFSSTSVRKKN